MACNEACDQTIKSEVEIGMRQKHSKRRHFRKNKRECNTWHTSHALPQPFGDSSQYNWFWENYYNALEWQERHQVAYWKSRSIALEYENTLLHQYVQRLVCNDENPGYFTKQKHVPKIPTSHSVSSSKGKKWNMKQQATPNGNSKEQEIREDSNQDEFEFEVTEEMMDFFEQSIRHKMELKEEREAERKKAEKEKGFDDAGLPPRKQIGLQRTEEMKLMYGEAAPMILGMETAMQLSFDRNCDLKQPKLWPNIPLKL